MSTLHERLEEIRPECPHGRKVRSLLDQGDACAGTIKRCECCENATCKPSSHENPWLCSTCKPGHDARPAGVTPLAEGTS